jgi:hypothetical protein
MRGLIAGVVLAALLVAGCGSDGKSSYTGNDVKAAYFRATDETAAARPLVEDYWVDDEYHSHANYVPREALETCPLSQRAEAPSESDHAVSPTAGEPVKEFVVGPKRDEDVRTPSITQGAFIFGTSTIAGNGMKTVSEAVAKCPPNYVVRGGPSPILGDYSVSSRPLDTGGWKGVIQQIAHTNPADDVYYEDAAHVIVQRANVILYLDVTHRKIIGERSDSSAKAESVLRTVLTRLG